MIYTSIIIPHRGPQKLLDRCVESIPKRDDVETIVIIDEQGKGAGWARNKGLEKAKGKYVIFADSDDFFHPCFGKFLDTLKEESADMVFFNADSIEQETGEPSWRANHINRIFHDTNKERQEKHLRYYFTEPWCRAIRLSLINKHHICFSESLKLNDIYFTSQVGLYAKAILVCNMTCYCIGNTNQSTAKIYSDERELHVVREAARANCFLKTHGINHIHSRMMRPFILAIFQGNFSFAGKCWKEMKTMGLSSMFLCYCLIRYPHDLIKLIYRKVQSKEIL